MGSIVWTLSGQIDASTELRIVPILTSPFRIGRRQDVSLCLPDSKVSGEHAELTLQDASIAVRDLGSTNGTYVNGERIRDASDLDTGDLLQFASLVFRVGQQLHGPDRMTAVENSADSALAYHQFERLMSERAAVPFFQPIISLKTGESVAYEVLGRSYLFGLKDPKAMFEAASQLNQQAALSRLLRSQGVQAGQTIKGEPHLFVNIHPVELIEEGLIESLTEIRLLYPDQRITLEIHEAAMTDADSMKKIRAGLAELNITVAYDDFGAGRARLVELIEVPPDYIKFDMQLIRGIHQASQSRQHAVSDLVRTVADLGIATIAEGIECEGEGATCAELGFQLAQGFYFGRPAPAKRFR